MSIASKLELSEPSVCLLISKYNNLNIDKIYPIKNDLIILITNGYKHDYICNKFGLTLEEIKKYLNNK